MIVKYITETEVLKVVEMKEFGHNEAAIDELKEQFDNKEVVSVAFEFIEGVQVSECHKLDSLNPSSIKQITVKIK